MFDGSLMLQVNLPVVYTIHSKGNELVTGVKIKATGESKLNDNPDSFQCHKKRIGMLIRNFEKKSSMGAKILFSGCGLNFFHL